MTRQLLAARVPGAQISHRLEPLPDRPDSYRLVFDVEEGHRVAIAEVVFVGNEHFSDDRLRACWDTKPEGFLWFRTGTFDEERLRDDLRGSLPEFYASHGFIDFAVVGDSLEVDPVTGKGRLIIEVEEGPQYRLAEFDVRGRAGSRPMTCGATSRNAAAACSAASVSAAAATAARRSAMSSTRSPSRRRPRTCSGCTRIRATCTRRSTRSSSDYRRTATDAAGPRRVGDRGGPAGVDPAGRSRATRTRTSR
jgi:hypothetical protein